MKRSRTRKPIIHRSVSRSVRSAFTLMEVMLVLVIIAAIAGLAIQNFTGIGQAADIKVAKIKISSLKTAVDTYKMNMRTLPPDLGALVEKPANVANANEWTKLLKEPAGADPWGNPYEYTVLDTDNYEIRSLGPDGTRSDDDVL